MSYLYVGGRLPARPERARAGSTAGRARGRQDTWRCLAARVLCSAHAQRAPCCPLRPVASRGVLVPGRNVGREANLAAAALCCLGSRCPSSPRPVGVAAVACLWARTRLQHKTQKAQRVHKVHAGIRRASSACAVREVKNKHRELPGPKMNIIYRVSHGTSFLAPGSLARRRLA